MHIKKAWNKKDIANKVFGKLTALRFSHIDEHKKSVWICKCACSRYTSVTLGALTTGQRTSCGCKTFKQGATKVCRKCKEVLTVPLTFTQGRLKAKNWICNVCHTAYYRKLTQTRPLRNKGSSLKSKYGITLAEYSILYAQQNSRCAICKKETQNLFAGKNGLYVDHCHKTKRVRGLLCRNCNFILGLANDEENILISAAQYLLKDK